MATDLAFFPFLARGEDAVFAAIGGIVDFAFRQQRGCPCRQRRIVFAVSKCKRGTAFHCMALSKINLDKSGQICICLARTTGSTPHLVLRKHGTTSAQNSFLSLT